MSHLRSKTTLAVLILVGALQACGTTTEPQEADPAIAVASGDAQAAGVGQPLADPLVVRVTRGGSAVSGTQVTWSVTAGGGSVSPASSTTDAAGEASTIWTVGPVAGTNTAQAAGTGLTGSPISFTAEGLPPAPLVVAVSVGDNFFDPTSARVAVGGTVNWTWAGTRGHNVTIPSRTPSATQTTGTFSQDFPTAGSFDYQCTIHNGMNGTIVVE